MYEGTGATQSLAGRLDELLPCIVDGNEAGIEAFASEFGANLRKTFRWRGVPEPDAEHLALDCISTIVLEIDGFEHQGPGSFARWCRAIASNMLADWFRRRTRRCEISLADGIASQPKHGQHKTSPVSNLEAAVLDALSHLTERERDILEVRYSGLAQSFAEAGWLLGVSEGVARVRHHRALKKLATVLGNDPVVIQWLERTSLGDSKL